MNELKQILEALQQPEYVHILLNPLPVYATAMGVLALVLGIITRSVPAKTVALVIILVGCVSVWPVGEYGERAADRVQSMSDADGRAWLRAHSARADAGQLVFYATAVLAAAAMVALWKFPKAGTWLTLLTLVAALVCLLAGRGVGLSAGRRVD